MTVNSASRRATYVSRRPWKPADYRQRDCRHCDYKELTRRTTCLRVLEVAHAMYEAASVTAPLNKAPIKKYGAAQFEARWGKIRLMPKL